MRAARPVADRLKPVAAILPPIVALAADLNESLRDTGTVEHLLLYMFYGTGAQARFDQFSHILPSYQIAGDCQQYAREPLEGCSAHFGDPPATASQARRPQRRASYDAQRVKTRSRRPSRARRPGPMRRSPTQPPALPTIPAPRDGGSPADVIQQALDFLLGAMTSKQHSLAGSPVLVGAATVLCAVVAVFLSYNANNGLPFVPTYDVTVQVHDAAGLVRGNEVRIGGKRVGVIEEIRAVEAKPGHDPHFGARGRADPDARGAAGRLAGHRPAALAARPQVPGAEAGELEGRDRGERKAAARRRRSQSSSSTRS